MPAATVRGLLSPVAGCKVMVVDDLKANTTLIHRVLSRAGLQHVREVQDPLTVTTLLAEEEPDLVLLDLRMPGLDGFAVLEQIQRHAAGTYLPVVVITADDAHENVKQALGRGAHDFVRKPFDAIELVLRVRNLLVTRMSYLELRRNRAWLKERLGLFERELAAIGEPVDAVAAEIRRIIDSDDLRIAVQPVVDMRTGEVVGGEALARFPATPFPHTGAWFAAALEVGLTTELELACARRAIRLLPGTAPGTRLGINFSPGTLIAGLPAALGEVAWDKVIIELTEHVPVESYTALNDALAPLRAAGAGVAVDDTGAGFASLRHILDVKPDTIKIDLAITRGVDADPSRAAIVTMLVAFARQMGLRIVAEGIETEAERDMMAALGVVYAQGFLFGRPEIVG